MAQYSKFYAALAAFVGVLIANGLLTGAVANWTSGIIAAVGAALVYLVPNTTSQPQRL